MCFMGIGFISLLWRKKKMGYLLHIFEMVIEDNNIGLIKQYHPNFKRKFLGICKSTCITETK